MKLFSIPNLITLANLFCGCIAIVCAFNGELVWAAYLVGIAAVLDFLDGFVARALKQYSAIGKDLDSLADMVTFGVVPGVVMFQLMDIAIRNMYSDPLISLELSYTEQLWLHLSKYLAFLITLFSALRLAKFNNDTRQSDSFIGVPTPANSILVCSFPLILLQLHTEYVQTIGHNWSVYPSDPSLVDIPVEYYVGGESFIPVHETFLSDAILSLPFLFGVTAVMCFLLISELPLFALKFKSFKWKGNEIRYSFLVAAVVMLVLLKFIALPLIIVLYILLSVVNNLMKPKAS